eukprot:gene18462-22595_t
MSGEDEVHGKVKQDSTEGGRVRAISKAEEAKVSDPASR